jgi:ABC-type Zn uptake system ZnuABC Zn-binding protein ZnuA
MWLSWRCFWLTSLLLAGSLFFPAWGGAAAGKIPVTASILPLGDFCEQIGGDRVALQVLIPPGASPHVFEPSPVAVAQALEARVFVFVGAGLDPWAARLIKSRGLEKLLVVKAVKGIPLLKEVAQHQHNHEKSHEPGHPRPATQEAKREHSVSAERLYQQGNPHVWLDPVLAQDICRRIAQAFIQIDPEHQQEYERNLAAYLGKLKDLNKEIMEKVATFRQRDYVCFHPAFAYFARRYGLSEVGVIEVAPGREPSPGHLQKTIAAIKNCGCRAVFAEPQLSRRMAEVIAQEAGVKVLLLDPLGGRPPYGSDYLKLMRHNLAVLAEALQ